MQSQVERTYKSADQLPFAFQDMTPQEFIELENLIMLQVKVGEGGCRALPKYILTGEVARTDERFKRIAKLTNFPVEKDVQNLFTGVSLIVAGAKSRADTIQTIDKVYADKTATMPYLGRAREQRLSKVGELSKMVANSFWDIKEQRQRKSVI